VSDLDLTAAVDAAARAIFEAMWASTAPPCPTWEDVPPPARHHHRESVLPAVAAAAEVIEQQVRERVAAEVEAEADARAAKRDTHRAASEVKRGGGNERLADMHMRTALSFRHEAIGLWDAARIARGEE
jgi:hypothetical protein